MYPPIEVGGIFIVLGFSLIITIYFSTDTFSWKQESITKLVTLLKANYNEFTGRKMHKKKFHEMFAMELKSIVSIIQIKIILGHILCKLLLYSIS